MILCGFVIYPVDFHEEPGKKRGWKTFGLEGY